MLKKLDEMKLGSTTLRFSRVVCSKHRQKGRQLNIGGVPDLVNSPKHNAWHEMTAAWLGWDLQAMSRPRTVQSADAEASKQASRENSRNHTLRPRRVWIDQIDQFIQANSGDKMWQNVTKTQSLTALVCPLSLVWPVYQDLQHNSRLQPSVSH